MFQETDSSLNDEKQWKDEFNCGKISFDLIDQKSDENGRILIIEAKINNNFIVINIYNSNTEYQQFKTFSILQSMLDDIAD